MVKPMSKLDTTPGKINGKVTLRNVLMRDSPRSSDASSKLGSSCWNDERKIAMQNGVQINTCPIMMV